jgi:hypothetical protein
VKAHVGVLNSLRELSSEPACKGAAVLSSKTQRREAGGSGPHETRHSGAEGAPCKAGSVQLAHLLAMALAELDWPAGLFTLLGHDVVCGVRAAGRAFFCRFSLVNGALNN